MMLPSAITSQLPAGLDPTAVSTCITVRGGLTSSFGETYLVLSNRNLFAFSRGSVVEPFTVLELASAKPPRYAQIKWDDVLLLTDRKGAEHHVELSTMNKRELLRALSTLYEEMGARDALLDALEQQLEVEGDRERSIQLRCTLGRMYLAIRNDAEHAVELFESILDERPDHRETIETMEALLKQFPDRISIAQVLEQAYRFSSRWDELIQIKQRIIPLTTHPREQRDHALELAELYLLKKSRPREALRAYGAALRFDPVNDTARDKVEELGDTLGDWREVARIYTEAIAANPGSEALFDLNLKLAEAWEDRLGDPKSAEHAWLSALKLKPDYIHGLERLRAIYRTHESWEPLTVILRALIQRHPDASVKVELVIEHGNILEHHLGRPEQAIRSYRAALDLEPNEELALDGLTRIYEHLEQWQPYYEILQKHLAICSDLEGRVDILRRLAVLGEEVFGDDEQAIEHWEHLLDEHDDEEAYQRLARLLVKHEEWTRLVSLLERRVSFTRDTEELFRLMTRLGAIWLHKLDDPARALAHYRRADELKPNTPQVLSVLVGLHDTLEQHEPHAGAIRRLIATNTLPAEQRYPLLVTLGGLHANHLQQPGEAIEALQKAVEVKRDDVAVLEQLQELLIQGRRWEEAVQVLQAKLQLTRDTATRVSILSRLADLYERRMGQHMQASDVLEQLVQLDPGQREAWARLEVIYKLTESWQRLIDLQTRRIAHTPDPERRVELLEQASHIAAKQAGDPSQALDILLERIEENWEERSMRLALAQFAAETSRWSDLLERYQALALSQPQHMRAIGVCIQEAITDIENASRARVRHALYLDLGAWFDTNGDPTRALDYYQRAYRMERSEDLFQTLRIRLRDAEQWRPLALLIQQAIESGERPAPQMYTLYTELADLHAGPLGNPEEAAQARRLSKKYKSRTGLYVGIVAILLIAGAGVGAYFYILSASSPPPVDYNDNAAQEAPETPAPAPAPDPTPDREPTESSRTPTPAPPSPPPQDASEERKLSKADVLTVVRDDATPAVRTCASQANQRGSVKVKWVIQPDGRVTDAELVTPEFAGTRLGTCVLRVVRGLRFPEHTGEPTPITYPFTIR